MHNYPSAPEGLSAGGRALWGAINEDNELDAAQLVQLTEACRAKDRLDRLDVMIADDLGFLKQANETANLMKQLLAALRLPDAASGRRPQHRGARGAYKPETGKVSSLDRARARAQA